MKIKLLLLVSLFIGSQASAQLSGNYTIGGVTPDYANFTDAIAALISTGVSGPVTFDVRNGIYPEKLVINEIPNASAVNTIIFQSEDRDSSVVTIEDSSTVGSATNYILQLNGADWVTFKQIGFHRLGAAAYGTVIAIGNYSTNNNFFNNYIVGASSVASSVNSTLIYSVAGTTSNDSNNTFRSNRMVNGSYGFNYLGASATVLERGTVIENNVIENTYGRALSIGNQNGANINNNSITVNSAVATTYGMYFTACDNNMIIRANKINLVSSGYGMYFNNCEGGIGLPINIYNNFIHTGGTGTAYGMYLTGSTNINCWYNSINVTSPATISRCVSIAGATSLKMVFQNNVIANTGGGTTFYVINAALAALSISNYNDLYSTGSNLAFWDAANVLDLTAWQAASTKDANSVSVDPIFASASNLHALGAGINDLATPVAGVTVDIDGEPRSGTTPDIGADEFLPLTDNVSMLALTQPSALGSCGQSSVTLEISIANLGSNSQSMIPVILEVTGAVTMTILDTVPGPLALNTTTTYTITQTLNTTNGGEYYIKLYTGLITDQFHDNDTINIKRTFYTIPNDPTAVSPQQGCNTSVGITATPDLGDVIFWYDEATGGNLIGIGNPLTVPINNDTTFYAEAHQGAGSGGCLRIVECQLGGTDYVELQNIGNVPFDATGWTLAISNSYTDINLVSPNQWSLGNFNAGEIQYKSDATADNYWGSNIFLNPGNQGWIVLLDAGNNIRDFIAFLWPDATIQAMAPVINGVPITIGTEWVGDGIPNCLTLSTTRIGNSDNNNAGDFACEADTKGTQNANLSTSFANCGLGLCGSGRIPVMVTMITGVSTSLGPDTTLVSPFSYMLDAGAGFVSYEWSDASTGQTLTATAPGTYWVTVSGSNGCSFTDSVEISIFTGIQLLSSSDKIQAYPNPANDLLTVNYTGADAIARIIDIKGRIISEQIMKAASGISVASFDLSNVETGLYFIQVLNKEDVLTMKLVVQH